MPTAIWIDGALGGADASVPVLDAGFLHGDSIFETMRAARGAVIDLEAHLDRFEAGARAIELSAPPRDEITAALATTIAAAGDADLRVRAIVTRGRVDGAWPHPLLVITAEPCPPLAEAPAPIVLALVERPLSDPRTLDPSLKTGSYLPNLLAQRAARALGGDEAVRLTSSGLCAEGATSNLFAVVDGVLTTPPTTLGIRAGVTRARVIALAGDVDERSFGPDELARATEAFVTSSIRGVAPARRLILGGVPIDWRAPGPRTQMIADAYREFASRVASRESDLR